MVLIGCIGMGTAVHLACAWPRAGGPGGWVLPLDDFGQLGGEQSLGTYGPGEGQLQNTVL